jgi:uncharacterized protein YkwD
MRHFKLSMVLALLAMLSGCIIPIPIPTGGGNSCSRPLAQPKRIDRSQLAVDFYRPTANDGLSAEERRLYENIMAYRQSLGLPRIPLSKSLTLTAGRHAEDMQKNLMPSGGLRPGTNYHSWSDVDYYVDHRNAKLMWQAPRRLGTPYCGNGYEISAWGYPTADETFRLWVSSPSHNAVIANKGMFRNQQWQAIGIGIAPRSSYGPPAYHVWFGTERDPAGAP